MMMSSIQEAFASDGPLATHLDGFSPRPQQQEMAQRIAEALLNKSQLIAEAGTGTGKTFAYLVPSLLSAKKILISTGTKNLQDQLFHKDVPLVQKSLGLPVSVALLKGRANYLCPHRLELALQDSRGLNNRGLNKLRRIHVWSGQTHSGDRAEVTTVAEDDPIWYRATSTADNCLGQECPRLNDCYLMKARRAAQAADIVIINHHLLFADMTLREQGFGELLPLADAVIIDEAHQLTEAASSFFGTSLSGNQILELVRDSLNEFYQEINEGHDLPRCAEALDKAVKDMRLAMGQAQRRGGWQELRGNQAFSKTVQAVAERLAALKQQLAPLSERSKGLESCHKRCLDLMERFAVLTAQEVDDYIHWFETHRHTFSLHLTPLDISENFQAHLNAMSGAWVFTSATLSVNGNFEHFASQLGLSEADTACWESPFDYARQALMYLPSGMPEPNSPDYTHAVIELSRSLLEQSRGRAFLLFTSYRALREAAAQLQDQIAYPVLVQGDAPRDKLLEQFRQHGNAVLLGTSSFWEGVDVRGEALSCVIIDKLPFASPGEPVLQARLEAVRRQGKNPFMSFQLPQAVIALKQGAGRLIRDSHDTGVLVLCDPRLRSKPYGRVFLASLPAMPRTHDPAQVQAFFAGLDKQQEASGHEAACH